MSLTIRKRSLIEAKIYAQRARQYMGYNPKIELRNKRIRPKTSYAAKSPSLWWPRGVLTYAHINKLMIIAKGEKSHTNTQPNRKGKLEQKKKVLSYNCIQFKRQRYINHTSMWWPTNQTLNLNYPDTYNQSNSLNACTCGGLYCSTEQIANGSLQ